MSKSIEAKEYVARRGWNSILDYSRRKAGIP